MIVALSKGRRKNPHWFDGKVRRITLEPERLLVELDPAVRAKGYDPEVEVSFASWRAGQPVSTAEDEQYLYPRDFASVRRELAYLFAGCELYRERVSEGQPPAGSKPRGAPPKGRQATKRSKRTRKPGGDPGSEP